MRLIGTLNNERDALAFSAFLNKKKINHQLDMVANRDWGSSDYGTITCQIWIHEEEQVSEAVKWYELFLQNPNDPLFTHIQKSSPPPLPTFPLNENESPSLVNKPSSSSEPNAVPWNKQPIGLITRLLLSICCALFFLSPLLTPVNDPMETLPSNIFSSPVQKWMLYDYPYKYQLINHFITLYGYEALKNPQDLNTEGRSLLTKIGDTPSWQGIYPIIKKQGVSAIETEMSQTPMFEKIREGEWWRVFTPCLMHADIFHLFFNMLWLIVLGKQIEQRLLPKRYLLFILVAGIFSNTSQYLVSGPNFIGFSGILCAMLTFIWIRQREAPWEGYQLDSMSLLFIMLFIFSMAALQLIFFFFDNSPDETFYSGIANTAHLSGALIGLILGKLNFFSWRHT